MTSSFYLMNTFLKMQTGRVIAALSQMPDDRRIRACIQCSGGDDFCKWTARCLTPKINL
jgi:hypothetical protein